MTDVKLSLLDSNAWKHLTMCKKMSSCWLVGWLVGFYGISTIVGYLMPNPLYRYILNIYQLVCLGFMAYQPL